MKKLLVSLLFAAATCLTGCESSASSGDTKSKLEGKGYTVEVLNSEQTKARIQGINYNVEIKDSVYATKGQKEIFLSFYCNSIDDATKLLNENVSVLYHFAEAFVETPKYGTFNNAVYVGSETSVSDAGFKLS